MEALLKILVASAWIWCCLAWTYVPVSDQNMVSSSDSIVIGTIVGTIDEENSGLSGTWTNYNVQVNQVLKSANILSNQLRTSSQNLVLSILGGYDPATDRTLFINGAPSFQFGDEVLLFLSHSESNGVIINQLAHFAMGAFHKVKSSSSTRRESEVDDFLAVRSFEMSLTRSSSMNDVPVRNFDQFVQFISEEVQSTESQNGIAYWDQISSSELMQLWADYMSVPETARFTTIQYNDETVRWSNFNTPIVWKRLESGQNDIDGQGEIEVDQAISAWNNQPNTAISYVDGGSTTAETAFISSDGINSVVFGDPKDVIPGAYDCKVGGTLGLGGWWTDGKSLTFRGIIFSNLVEADIVTQDGIECWLNSVTDKSASFANLMTHEFGHTLGLDHSCGDESSGNCVSGSDSDNAVMRAKVHDNGGAILSIDDDNGIEYIYADCYPDCPRNFTIGTSDEEVDSDKKASGLSKKNIWITVSIVAFVVSFAIVVFVAFVVVRNRRAAMQQRVRSRSSSLIIDPYDHIDIPGYIGASPQSFISPSRISYYDHFNIVSSNLSQLQTQSTYSVPRAYTSPNIGLIKKEEEKEQKEEKGFNNEEK